MEMEKVTWECPSNDGRYRISVRISPMAVGGGTKAAIVIDCEGLDGDGVWSLSLSSVVVPLEAWRNLADSIDAWVSDGRDFEVDLTGNELTAVSISVSSKADDIILTVGKAAWRVRWRAMGSPLSEVVWEVDQSCLRQASEGLHGVHSVNP